MQPPSVDDRFEHLETRFAYQEKALAELSDVVFQQQLSIDLLERRVRKMSEQMRELGIAGDDSKDQVPPHY
jgi:SlyX protein